MDTLGEYTDDRADLRTSVVLAPVRHWTKETGVST